LPTLYFITPFIALGLFILVLWSLKFSRLVFFGFLFFLANIILVLQFLSVGLAITSDRYSYVPYIGLFFIIAMGYHKLRNSADKKLSVYKPVATIALVIFGFVFCIATYARCQVWKNNETMWTDVIAKYPDDYLAYDNRGVYYRTIKRNDLALADYNMVVKNNPKYALGFNNRGNIYFDAGKDSMALEDYNRALALDSGGVRTYTNRALIYSRRKQNELAERDFARAYKLDSTFDKLYFNRGIYYDLTDQEEKALVDFHKYLQMNPKDDGIVNSCGVALQKLHKYEESIPEFTKAIALNPKQGAYLLNRSISENVVGQKDNARNDAIAAQKLGSKIDPAYLKMIGL
jgi:tetratricopeptide (TPR) repeat protein